MMKTAVGCFAQHACPSHATSELAWFVIDVANNVDSYIPYLKPTFGCCVSLADVCMESLKYVMYHSARYTCAHEVWCGLSLFWLVTFIRTFLVNAAGSVAQLCRCT